MKINELRDTSHSAARSKGWWDGVIRSEEEISMLVVTEIAEASEAVRKKMPPICQFAATDPAMRTPDMEGGVWNWQLKPEGEAVELADALIRICDYFGWKGWDLAGAIQDGLAWGDPASSMTITELGQRCFAQHSYIGTKEPLAAHLFMTAWASKVVDNLDAKTALGQCTGLILAYCSAKGLPLQEAIDHKLKYNETRSYRHGNKAL